MQIAVATSSPVDRARYHLGMVDLLNKFEGIASAHNVKHGKPEPDVFLYAAKKLGVTHSTFLRWVNEENG